MTTGIALSMHTPAESAAGVAHVAPYYHYYHVLELAPLRSYGRYADGGNYAVLASRTPGGPNGGRASAEEVHASPQLPRAPPLPPAASVLRLSEVRCLCIL